jgi:cob(I)alamin adenosyltransferase
MCGKSAVINMKPKGQVYIFTGDGKGKTSAALGVAVRAVGSGMRVTMVQWYKQSSWDISEHKLPKLINKLKIYPMGAGFHLKNQRSKIKDQKNKKIKTALLKTGGVVVDTASNQQHQQAAQAALAKAQSLLGKVDVLILDEVNNALHDKLISPTSLTKLINSRGPTHLILTGRDAHQNILKLADLVTKMKKVKHPFDKGQSAIKGLDF